ncbi:hypothetical protein LINPERHAP1_LOCUS1795, partial [Linum perenne]
MLCSSNFQLIRDKKNLRQNISYFLVFICTHLQKCTPLRFRYTLRGRSKVIIQTSRGTVIVIKQSTTVPCPCISR